MPLNCMGCSRTEDEGEDEKRKMLWMWFLISVLGDEEIKIKNKNCHVGQIPFNLFPFPPSLRTLR